eukprot:scaffold272954_cov18-Tisochrysis_lutea.AAC.1
MQRRWRGRCVRMGLCVLSSVDAVAWQVHRSVHARAVVCCSIRGCLICDSCNDGTREAVFSVWFQAPSRELMGLLWRKGRCKEGMSATARR